MTLFEILIKNRTRVFANSNKETEEKVCDFIAMQQTLFQSQAKWEDRAGEGLTK